MFHLILGNADACIRYSDGSLFVGDTNAERYLPARSGILHGIVEQVVEHLFYLVGVEPCLLVHATDVLLEGKLLGGEHRHQAAASLVAEVAQFPLAYLKL